MVIQTIKMSSRGQIVIPQEIREHLGADEGTLFAVVGNGSDTLVLKRIATPSKEELIKELAVLALKGRKRAEMLGIKESDVHGLVQRLRKSK